jgi:hypothetical protein
MFADTQISRCNQTKCGAASVLLRWPSTVESDCVGGGSIKFGVSLELFLLSRFHDISMFVYAFRNCKWVFCNYFGVWRISGQLKVK